MGSFNKLILVGYLGRDPELRHTPQGTAVCNLSIATTERRKEGGEMMEVTTWFRVTAWGRLAELCNLWGKKGRQVYVDGRLSQEEYKDRDGNNRTSLIVNASDIQFLDKKGEASEPAQSAKAAAHEFQKSPTKPSNDYPQDDSVPF